MFYFVVNKYLLNPEIHLLLQARRLNRVYDDWLKIEKGVQWGCLLSPCLFNLYAEHVVRNARLDELQVGIKIGERNINNLRYADDITLMAESDEQLKSILIRVKEESERAGLKLNIKKLKKLRSWHLVPLLRGK